MRLAAGDKSNNHAGKINTNVSSIVSLKLRLIIPNSATAENSLRPLSPVSVRHSVSRELDALLDPSNPRARLAPARAILIARISQKLD